MSHVDEKGSAEVDCGMGLQDVVRWFVPKEDQFFRFLEGQAEKAHDGALALRRFNEGGSAKEVREAVQALEHEGDRLCHELEEALAKTFVTPIDREDIQKLSAELDDILDRANGAIRAADLQGLKKPTPHMGRLMDLLVKCTLVIKDTVPNLRKNAYPEITEGTRALRILEKEGDVVYQESVSKLFHDDTIDAKELLRQKEILETLEEAIDHCESVGESLAHLAVKHG